ncbi:MAG: signal peptide peptidase SppA [Ahrensia sp.]|nr:signal peptide peptidase SppA [Ahrensia sp.]
MVLDVDSFIDRRQLRRKLSFWRIAALLAIIAAITSLLSAVGAFSGFGQPVQHIARVSISGVITEDKPLIEMLERIGKDDQVKGIVLSIDSPGGTTVGGEAIYGAVRKLSEKKPVVTSVGTLAASAGYMIASASDHIVARRSSIVGSIGVIFQYPQATELLDKIGVDVKEIKSSPLKAEPSPFNPTPPEAVTAIQELVDDSYRWFVDLVAERRSLERDEVLKIADGRVFSGGRGLDLKLVDAVGGEDLAKKWLVEKKGLDETLKLLDWKPERPTDGLIFNTAATRWLAGLLGVEWGKLDTKLPGQVEKRLFLDGLLSIWHG